MAMRERPGVFILNKKSDFAKGCGGSWENERLIIGSSFVSGVYDSREKGMRWYKLELDMSLPVNSYMKLTFYAADSREIEYGGRLCDISELISSDMSFDEKKKLFAHIESFSAEAASEMLLTSVRGRYLFFSAEVHSAGNDKAYISSARLSFRPFLWVNYLPEIYRENDNSFIERYLAIFQSVYERNERMIERSALSYTAGNAPYEFLKWLSGWYCMINTELWNERQLRYLMMNASRIYSQIGTKEVIAELCELYLGERPDIIEYKSKFDKAFINGYGIGLDRIFIDPYTFTVIIKNKTLSASERETLGQIIDSCRPAHIEANIIVLRSDVRTVGKLDQNVLDDGDGGLTLS